MKCLVENICPIPDQLKNGESLVGTVMTGAWANVDKVVRAFGSKPFLPPSVAKISLNIGDHLYFIASKESAWLYS